MTRSGARHLSAMISGGLLLAACSTMAGAQQASISTWDAADFRIWGYIPYWTTSSQINAFATNGMYSHVSDVLYFGAVRPDANGNLSYGSSSYQTSLNTLRTQSAAIGFNLELSMMAVNGSSVNSVWTSIINSPANRANFVNNVKALMMGGPGTADDIKGFNFDWERPSTASLWGNYTQLARELQAAFDSPSTPTTNNWQVSVCDYGSTDTSWDNTSLFDANVYDQLFMMSYHLSASSTGTYANQKLNLTQQGASKAFTNDQIAVGFGTWGTNGPATVTLDAIVQANPNLPYDALSFTGTVPDINGVMRTGTWTIESRKQVREKAQLALDRGMPGMFNWAMNYDATGKLGLDRVIHHYVVVKRDVPDLNLDGKVDAGDAVALANDMGMSTTNTGMTTAAQFDAFYLNGNWEAGDHDGNGFVNQQDADWLAGRYAALNVSLPDRLAYTGTFENFQNSQGLAGRWRAARNAQNNLIETGNFKQEPANFLPWHGTGAGANQHSNNFVTLRNQNAAEAAAGINTQSRSMQADLSDPIDLSQNRDTFFTFLIRENANALSASQLASGNRMLSLEFLDTAGTDQFDIAFHGLQHQLSLVNRADATGQDVSMDGFGSNATYLIVGRIVGNGAGANILQASFFADSATVNDFMTPDFPWMLTAYGSAGYNPVITDLRFFTLSEANYTVSNLWISGMDEIPEPEACSLILLALVAAGSRSLRPNLSGVINA